MGKSASKFTPLQIVLGSAHTFWAPWLSINASSKTPYTYPLTFHNHLSYSIFKIIPSYGAIFWQNCCKPLLVRPQSGSLPIPIVSSKTRHKGWQLAPRVSHGKDISSCTGNKIQCCQLHPEQFKPRYLTPAFKCGTESDSLRIFKSNAQRNAGNLSSIRWLHKVILIYLRREIPERFKLTWCEKRFLCYQIWIEAGKSLHPGISSIYFRASQIYVSSMFKTKSRKKKCCLFWCQRASSQFSQLLWRNRPANINWDRLTNYNMYIEITN